MSKYITDLRSTLKEHNKSDEALLDQFLNPSKKLREFFEGIYHEYRHNRDCHTNEKINEKNKELKSCEAVNNENLRNAINNSRNIVLETTGEYAPNWLFDLYKNEIEKYNVIFAWTIVEICELLIRNKSRARDMVKTFIKNENASTPRLPDIDPDTYRDKLKRIIKVFHEINGNKCNDGVKKCLCLVFDNNEKDSLVIYDSSKDDNSKAKKAINGYEVDNNCQ